MIHYTTRFNVTTNGFCHLGHAMMCLINRAEATAHGGKFLVRFDDSQRSWLWLHTPSEIASYRMELVADLEWMGIQVDGYSSQVDLMPEVDRWIDAVGWPVKPQPMAGIYNSEVIGINAPMYPYAERLTAEKCVMDHIQGMTWIIRGHDLLTEDCLYRYFVDKLELSQPRMTYIPRLEFEGDEVSKTRGNYKIRDYRALKIDPQRELIELLALDCLKDPFGGWFVDNVKARPVLGEWAKRLLA
jgi:glutamyl/glutaminyl-tRNA synthetase